MEKQNAQVLNKILQNFEGMEKIDSLDLLQKLEVLLYYAKSPLNRENINEIISRDFEPIEIDPYEMYFLPNRKFCEFVGANNWLHIYTTCNKGYNKFKIFPRYYYRTKFAPLELLKLTKKNLLESIENTNIEPKVIKYLKKNHISKKNNTANKIMLLDIV